MGLSERHQVRVWEKWGGRGRKETFFRELKKLFSGLIGFLQILYSHLIFVTHQLRQQGEAAVMGMMRLAEQPGRALATSSPPQQIAPHGTGPPLWEQQPQPPRFRGPALTQRCWGGRVCHSEKGQRWSSSTGRGGGEGPY